MTEPRETPREGLERLLRDEIERAEQITMPCFKALGPDYDFIVEFMRERLAHAQDALINSDLPEMMYCYHELRNEPR